jgi:hypothetical protein
MARTKSAIWLQVSGSLGNQIIYKKYYDKTVISAKPDMSKRKLSEKQKEWNVRMSYATAYAQSFNDIPEEKIKARIRLKLPTHKSVFNALVQEHLNRYKHLPLEDARMQMLADANEKK